MDKKTQVNPNIDKDTILNSKVNQATSINFILNTANPRIVKGTYLNEKYKIIEPLSISSGEADLYLCEADSIKYVVKVYRRQNAIKAETIDVLKSIELPFVAHICDTGVYNGNPYTIIPYYKNGSLQGKTFTLQELKSIIIPCINQALKCLHENGLFHKDLKPSNIMFLDNRESVAIIDFGISSVVNDSTVLVTSTGMTVAYAAPETFRGVYLIESDYYSFGITIYELFFGYTPYQNYSEDEIARFISVQKIPFPENAPEELKNLITGLTYHDLTNRHNKENPNRRWTYQEVDNWLNDKKQAIPGEGTDRQVENSIPVYTFHGGKYKDIPSLIAVLASNWEDGKKELYRGIMFNFFSRCNPEIAGFCIDAEEEVSKNRKNEDIVFWELLLRICPEFNGFYWLGHTYNSLQVLGNEMLEKLWVNDNSDWDYWNSILDNHLLSKYLVNIKSQNNELVQIVSALESSYKINVNNKRGQMIDYYTMAYLLSGEKLFAIGDKRLRSVVELISYMKELLSSSCEEFEFFCHSMIDYNDNLNPQLEAWLIALGKQKELDKWRKSLSE